MLLHSNVIGFHRLFLIFVQVGVPWVE